MNSTEPDDNQADLQGDNIEEAEATPSIESTETPSDSARHVSRMPQVRSTPTMKVRS
jgi:hypothetical protein